MKTSQRWTLYGVVSAVGLSLVGGAAAVAADTMTLRTGDGSIIPGGPAVGDAKSVLDVQGIALRVGTSSVSVVTPLTPVSASAPGASAPGASTPATAVTAPGAPSQPANAPAPATPASPPTATPVTAPSAPDSPPVPATPPSTPTAVSPAD